MNIDEEQDELHDEEEQLLDEQLLDELDDEQLLDELEEQVCVAPAILRFVANIILSPNPESMPVNISDIPELDTVGDAPKSDNRDVVNAVALDPSFSINTYFDAVSFDSHGTKYILDVRNSTAHIRANPYERELTILKSVLNHPFAVKKLI